MKTRFLAFATLSVLAVGCVVDNPAAYDSCKSAKDCSGLAAESCVSVTQAWPGGALSTGAICTTTSCTSDSSCSLSANGSLGFCATTSILGAPGGTCFERCTSDFNCSSGYSCASSKDVYGLPPGELICVPSKTVYVPPPAAAYESCAAGSGVTCAGTYAAYCTEITQPWSNGTVVDSICTNGCSSDYECATSYNGSYGLCSTTAVLGRQAGTCFERCYYDSDCAVGFVCSDSKEVSGLKGTEQICVPAPNGGYTPVLSDPYETCYDLDECSLASTRCEPLDPKWETTTDQNAISICTEACAFDSDCPTSYSGQAGYCAPQDTIAFMQVCVERCYSSNDCLGGFVCAQMQEIVGLPNSTEGVCVPYPY